MFPSPKSIFLMLILGRDVNRYHPLLYLKRLDWKERRSSEHDLRCHKTPAGLDHVNPEFKPIRFRERAAV